MTCTMGIDIGTFESKGVLVDTEGRIVAEARHPHKMMVPQPGWAEHDPMRDWWGDFARLSRELLEKSGVRPGDVECVAPSAIGPCMLPVGSDGEPLMNGVLYGVDTRAAAEVEELTGRMGIDTLLERCGNALTSQSVGPKILWLKRNLPDIHSRAAKFLTSTSFVVYKLTGRYSIDHYTAANFAPLYDIERMDWTADLADDISAIEALPDLMWSTEIAGCVTREAAAETGLAEGTRVTCGTIDAAAEAISVGVRQPGDLMIMYGSTIFAILVTSDSARDPRLWHAPWLFPGEMACMAGLATSGTLTHWFRDQFARELPPESAFEALAAEAGKSPPGANGLIMLPYFSGERTPIHDPDAKGAFFGLNLSHTRGDMYRALLEGIAMATGHVIETYRDTGMDPSRIRAVGGGTKNKIWLQATSDFANVRQALCEHSVGASYGDAFLASVALGAATASDIDKWNPERQTVRPNLQQVPEGHYENFKALYVRTREIAHDLGAHEAVPAT